MLKRLKPIKMNVLSCDSSKPISWESAMGQMFMGLAFFVVSVVLALTGRASGWWFWMLIPAFSILGSGVAQYVQLKKSEQKTALTSQSAPERNLFRAGNFCAAADAVIMSSRRKNQFTTPASSQCRRA
jgi:hypothetical protein